MKKHYLLLRDNEQSGPFQIDELLQQQLKPGDLIWVEGESFAWAYPQEVEELKNIFATAGSRKTKFSNRDSDEIEYKAEELRKQAMAYAAWHTFRPKIEFKNDTGGNMLPLVEEQISFVMHKKTSRFPWNEAVTIVLAAGVFGAAIYGGRHAFFMPKTAVQSAATQIISVDRHAALKQPETPVVTAVLPVTDTIQTSGITTTAYNAPVQRQVRTKAPAMVKEEADTEVTQSVTVAEPEKKKEAPATVNVVEEKDKKVATASQPAPQEIVKKEPEPSKKEEAVTDESLEKKKTLGDALKGLFKKKKKKEGSEAEADAAN